LSIIAKIEAVILDNKYLHVIITQLNFVVLILTASECGYETIIYISSSFVIIFYCILSFKM